MPNEKDGQETMPKEGEQQQADSEQVSPEEVGEKKPEPKAEPQQEAKKPQTREENAFYAQKRREAEAKAKAEKEAREKSIFEDGVRKGKIESIKTNPYTETEIKTDRDLEIYETMKKLDDEGKDPLKSFPSYLAEKLEESDAKAKEEAAKKEKEAAAKQADAKRLQDDLGKAQKEYPDIDFAKALSDPKLNEWLLDEENSKLSLSKNIKYFLLENPKGLDAYSTKKKSAPQSTPSSVGDSRKEKLFSEMSDDEYVAYSEKHHGGF